MRRVSPWLYAGLAGIVYFLGVVSRFYEPGNGFTSLLMIGSQLERTEIPGLKAIPHYVYEDVVGYDGAFYVQIALHPLLGDPALSGAIDNPNYRARRILLPWAGWLAGLGRPQWIVQVFPLLNVACWLGLAFLLWAWIPPDGIGNLLRWGGVMFSHGLCASVRNSLADGPALLLVALAVYWHQRRKEKSATVALALAMLTKETSVLALTLSAPLRSKKWGRWIWTSGLAVMPLVVWIIYVRVRFGPSGDAGLGNFTLPLMGLAQKCAEIWWDNGGIGWQSPRLLNLVTATALTVQFLFLVARWQPRDPWWRIGVVFAVLMAFLAKPVWEGYPGAATRVLLPMTLAFNLVVPRGVRWLPVLLAGNLSILAGVAEFAAPPREMMAYSGHPAAVATTRVVWGEGWYQVEWNGKKTWRWGRERAVLAVVNRSNRAHEMRLTMDMWSNSPRRVGVRVNGVEQGGIELTPRTSELRLPAFFVPPGDSLIEFTSDQPDAYTMHADPRPLNFAVSNLRIAVAPMEAGNQP